MVRIARISGAVIAACWPLQAVCGGEQAPETLTPQTILGLAKDSIVRITVKDANGYAFSGTGFFVNDDLHVVTSYHVVAGATQIRVEGTSGADWNVVQVKLNKATDLALLRLDTPSGRRPLPYSSFGSLHARDEVTVIGNRLSGSADNLLPEVVSEVKMLKGQTVLLFGGVSAFPMGSPVFNALGRVVAVTRSPLPEVEGQSLGVSVLGINFLGAPQTWAAFASSSQASSAGPFLHRPASGPSGKIAFAQAFGAWLNVVAGAGLKWQHAYLSLCAQDPPRDPSTLDASAAGFALALTEGLRDVHEAARTIGAGPDLDRREAELAAAAAELLAAEKSSIAEGQQIDLQRTAAAITRCNAAESAFNTAFEKFASLLGDATQQPLRSVSFEIAPPALAWITLKRDFDGIPDPGKPDEAVIGAAIPGSDFVPGDVVEGVAGSMQDGFVPVANWKDIAEYVAEHPKLNRLYVRVLRRSAHAMFYSRRGG